MRALALACLLGIAAAATGVEPERPVWPQEFQVTAATAAACRRRRPAPACTCRCQPRLPFTYHPWQISFDFEVPYVKEYQKEGLT